MVNHSRFRLMLFALILPAGGVAALQSGQMEVVEVVGSKIPDPLMHRSATTTVIDRQEIDASNKRSLVHLLRAVAGISVNQQGGDGGVTSLYVRGGEANFTVIMIDGIQVNNPTNTRGGSFDLSLVDIESIERIEIVRGPQTALYGSDALSGVINIVTRESVADRSNSITAETGDDQFGRVFYQLSKETTSGTKVHLGVGKRDAGDKNRNGTSDLTTISAKLLSPAASATSIQVTLRDTRFESRTFPEDSGGFEFARTREMALREAEESLAGLKLRQSLTEASSISVSASWYNIETSDLSPGIYPFMQVPPNTHFTRFKRNSYSAHFQRLGNSSALVIGLDAELENGDTEGVVDFGVQIPTGFSDARETYSAFTELSAALTSSTRISGAIRRDRLQGYGYETTHRVGLIQRFCNEKLALKANLGKGFKMPSFFALSHPIVGNPELIPERVESFDVGLEYLFESGAELSLVYFDNGFENLVDFDDSQFKNINRSEVDSSGVELVASSPREASVLVRGQATYLDVDVKNSNEKLRGRPQWQYAIALEWLPADNWQLWLDYGWRDHVVEASLHSGQSLDYQLDDVHRLDLNLGWRPTKDLKLQFALENVLDSRYEEAVGFRANGINPRLSVSYRL